MTIHIIILAGIAWWLASDYSPGQVTPADVDVVEIEEPQEDPGKKVSEPSSPPLIEGKVTERPPQTPIEPRAASEPPAIELPTPEPEGPRDPAKPIVDLKEQERQLARTEEAMQKLRENIKKSDPGGAEKNTGNPNSRAAQQGRWTIDYTGTDCDSFVAMMRGIGMDEAAVLLDDGSTLTYIDPSTGRKRSGSTASESRMCWSHTSGFLGPCERLVLEKARLEAFYIVWFMRRDQEPELKRLEDAYAKQRGIDIARVVSTIFRPRQEDGRWGLDVLEVRVGP